ncbi:MAG: glycosyltransferase [Chryseobacterium sp.]|uniref:glycosyltransferase n=1 Tax=Chryseobacterium sp. TaxID=1871047 RepID=UPI001B02BF49|nr:glycosyltransferase [Chryseobacterium sp.]MBO6185066.1 glycosyltransferase [Chryseobacterium sp.]
MRILFITTELGKRAPGKVYESFIDDYIKKYGEENIDIITTESNSNSNNVKIYKRRYIHPRLRKLSVILFSVDLFDWLLAKRINKSIDVTEYDVVFSLMSLHNFMPLYLGNLLKNSNKKVDWYVYSVDAVPPPLGWGESTFYRKGLIKMVRTYFKNVNKFYSSNEVMLNYQLNLLDYSFSGGKGYIHTPGKYKEKKIFVKNNDGFFNLLYTGGIYGVRRPESLIEAFYKITLHYENTRLYFVGTNPISVDLSKYDDTFKSKVIFVGYTDDLEKYYQLADVLIDIDADLDNDVFMSSKFFNYIMINRPVLSITRENSPTYLYTLKNELENIHFAKHYTDDIENVLKNLINDNK